MSIYWTQTIGRRAFDFEEPTVDMIDINDIAYSLSNLARYNGHSRPVYSVGEHSFRVASHLPSELKLVGLMHDAAEAYTGDLIAPIKHMPQFRAPWKYLEDKIWRVIAAKYGMPEELPPEVKEADLRMLETEKRDLGFLPTPREWVVTGLEPYADTITPFSGPYLVREVFMARFKDLYRGSEA